jgi:hypothetical protein
MKTLRPLVLAACAAVSSEVGAEPIFLDGFETPTEEPAAYDCNVEGVMPASLNLFVSDWINTFSSPDGSPQAVYPKGVSFPTPVGADRNQMRVVPFVPNPAQGVNLYWDQVQSRPSEGYEQRPAYAMWFAISPCPGDVRPPNPFGEPFLREGCREYAGSASLLWTTARSVPESDAVRCKLEAGRTYYLTIAPLDPRDGLQFGEHTCHEEFLGCDVGVVLQTLTGD